MLLHSRPMLRHWLYDLVHVLCAMWPVWGLLAVEWSFRRSERNATRRTRSRFAGNRVERDYIGDDGTVYRLRDRVR